MVAEASLHPREHEAFFSCEGKNLELHTVTTVYVCVCQIHFFCMHSSSSGVNPVMNAACLARKKSDKVGSSLDQHVEQFWFPQRIKTI